MVPRLGYFAWCVSGNHESHRSETIALIPRTTEFIDQELFFQPKIGKYNACEGKREKLDKKELKLMYREHALFNRRNDSHPARECSF